MSVLPIFAHQKCKNAVQRKICSAREQIGEKIFICLFFRFSWIVEATKVRAAYEAGKTKTCIGGRSWYRVF
jgi:hypothetical protein